MGNIYSNLAVNAIRKNRNFYLPYIASSVVMIAMFFILYTLGRDPVLKLVHGYRTMNMILQVGLPVIGLLSALFIIYMSSFIMKRRKKELGLYSVLGMEKRHIIRVLFIENIIVSTCSIVIGIITGSLFEKIAQLLLLRILHVGADYSISVNTKGIIATAVLFAVIYLFILIKSIGEILFTPTLKYIKEEQAGEKKPRARWGLGIIGLVILAVAYYLACTVTTGSVAISRFVNAVFLVIVATYILFIVGSIAVLEIMKRNKKYYYRTNHFISVSGMTYRMKRNGAGLASICILSTMVLVMMSSVTTVFFYNGKMFDDRFTYDFSIRCENTGHLETEELELDPQHIIDEVYACAAEADVTVNRMVTYHTYDYFGSIDGNYVGCSPRFDGIYYEIWLIPVSDYNAVNNMDVSLGSNQVGWYFLNGNYDFSEGDIQLEGIGTYEGVRLDSRPEIMPGEYTSTSDDILFIVIPDSLKLTDAIESLDAFWLEEANANGYEYYPTYTDYTYFAFDVDGGMEGTQAFFDQYTEMYCYQVDEEDMSEMNTAMGSYNGFYRTLFSSMLFEQVFYNMYGALFFLGILLSICCIVIAVLIMYFKQLLEGYEDAKRFTIMKKVGLTGDEIKKSIYSQIVMVFLTPILAAGVHTAFAYNMIKSLIKLFGVSNIDGYFVILLICMVVFTAFYIVVFWITSQKYLKIVNAAENAV